MELKINTSYGTLNLINNPYFTITNIDGMTELASTVSSAASSFDGDYITNIKANYRPLVFYFRLLGNVEEAKQQILSKIKFNDTAEVEWFQKNSRKFISGVVENISMPRWTNGAIMQVTLHCSEPFWRSAEKFVYDDTIQTAVVSAPNNGDVPCGMNFKIIAYTADVQIPQIINTVTTEMLKFNITLHAGEVLEVSTERGNIYATIDGQSVIHMRQDNPVWHQLAVGANSFTISCENEAGFRYEVRYREKYV